MRYSMTDWRLEWWIARRETLDNGWVRVQYAFRNGRTVWVNFYPGRAFEENILRTGEALSKE